MTGIASELAGAYDHGMEATEKLTRRFRFLRVNQELLLRLLQKATTLDGTLLLQWCEIPEKTQIVSVHYEHGDGSFWFMLWHPDWPELEPGDQIPEMPRVMCHTIEVVERPEKGEPAEVRGCKP